MMRTTNDPIPETREPDGAAAPDNRLRTGERLAGSRPKYRILQDLLRAGIADGTLANDTGKLPSEHDLAKQYGVAYMTIRGAVNELVSEGLLRRVHGRGTFVRRDRRDAAADEPARPRGLSLFVPSLPMLWNVAGLYYFPGIVQGFCAEATHLGYEPSVIGGTKDTLAPASGDMPGVSAGAACLLITRDDVATLESLRDLRVPVIGINRYTGRRTIPFVAADQEAGMADIVEYLARRGHRRLAFLPGPAGNLGADERRRGFRRATAALSIQGEIFGADPAEYTDISGAIRARTLLSRPADVRPTAIVTAGDLIAAGVVETARELGLSVPGDLSVAGFGDFHIARYIQPALTTVRLPLEELGAGAARLLHAQISGESPRQRAVVSLATGIVERDSIADAPQP